MATQASQKASSQDNFNLGNHPFQEPVKMLRRCAVGTFPNYEVTEVALRELKDNGFVMDRVSVVGRDIHHHSDFAGANVSDQVTGVNQLDTNQNKAEEGARKGTVAGSTVGSLAGLLVGLGAITIPGVGPVMLAGAAATAIATAISGGVIGGAAGSLVGGLMGLGIPADRAKAYSDRVSQGDYLAMVEGSEADITLAASIFNKHNIREWYIYDLSVESMPNVTAASTTTLAGRHSQGQKIDQ
jgi:hypothetical protein